MAKAVTGAKVISQQIWAHFLFRNLKHHTKLKKTLMSAKIQQTVILRKQIALYTIANAANTSMSVTVER